MKVKIKRIDKTLPLPEYQTKGAVAFDLYAREDTVIAPNQIARIPTNIIVEIPEGFMLMIKDRSSTLSKKGLLTHTGFIDQDYRGPEDEIKLQVLNFQKEPVTVTRGERLGQAAFVPIQIASWQEVEEMDSNQSRGGFGTTDQINEKYRGKFIVLEGQGFSGKTEQAPLLVAKLKELGIDVTITQEPGGVASAVAIREEILKKHGTIPAEEEVELFFKSRERFLEELVRPSLTGGTWIVSTRFSASSYVYQGREGGVDLDFIRQIEDKVVGPTQPDLYILLDVEPEEIYNRLTSKDSRQKHSYNEVNPEIINKRAIYYLELAHENRHKNWVIIDGNGTVEEVRLRIWRAVSEKFNLKPLQ